MQKAELCIVRLESQSYNVSWSAVHAV